MMARLPCPMTCRLSHIPRNTGRTDAAASLCKLHTSDTISTLWWWELVSIYTRWWSFITHLYWLRFFSACFWARPRYFTYYSVIGDIGDVRIQWRNVRYVTIHNAKSAKSPIGLACSGRKHGKISKESSFLSVLYLILLSTESWVSSTTRDISQNLRKKGVCVEALKSGSSWFAWRSFSGLSATLPCRHTISAYYCWDSSALVYISTSTPRQV